MNGGPRCVTPVHCLPGCIPLSLPCLSSAIAVLTILHSAHIVNDKRSREHWITNSTYCQQFFPATSPHWWQKRLVPTHTLANLQIQLWTKHSQIGMHKHSWQNCCTELWLIWLSRARSAVTKVMISWVNQRQHANQYICIRRMTAVLPSLCNVV